VQWYRLAVAQENAEAQLRLGTIFFKGVGGVPQDYKEAIKLIRLAAEQGHVQAQMKLGILSELGMGVKKSLIYSHMWLNIATTNANSEEEKQMVGLRDSVAKKMTADQIAEAQVLAKSCIAKKLKGC
jgi:hypothetical protein